MTESASVREVVKRPAQIALLLTVCLPLCSCVQAPEFNILGSYFPAWMVCLFAGILLTVLLRLFVNRFHLEDYLRPTVLTYPSTAALFTFTLWLAFFN